MHKLIFLLTLLFAFSLGHTAQLSTVEQKYFDALEKQNAELIKQTQEMKDENQKLRDAYKTDIEELANSNKEHDKYLTETREQLNEQIDYINLILSITSIFVAIVTAIAGAFAFLFKRKAEKRIEEITEQYKKLEKNASTLQTTYEENINKAYKTYSEKTNILDNKIMEIDKTYKFLLDQKDKIEQHFNKLLENHNNLEQKIASGEINLSNVNAEQIKSFIKEYVSNLNLIKTEDDYSETDWMVVGNEHFNNIEYEQAIEAYKKVLNSDSKNDLAWFNIGYSYDELKEYEEAVKAYEKAIEIKPDYHEAWYNKGIALGKLERYEEAVKAYERAIEIKPDKHEAWNGKADTFRLMKRYDEAMECVDRAISLEKNEIYSITTKAEILFDMEKYEESLEWVNKALKINSAFEDAVVLKKQLEDKGYK